MHNSSAEGDAEWGKQQAELEGMYDARIRAVREIIDEYMEEPMEGENLAKLCRHIAGWLDCLKAGIRFSSWNGKTGVWASIYVRDCARVPSTNNKQMYQVSYASTAGPTVCEEWNLTQTSTALQYILREIGGIPKYETHRPDDIGGMWFTAYLVPLQKGFKFEYIHSSSSQTAKNKTIYKYRQAGCRVKTSPHYMKACNTCPLSRSMCPLSRIDVAYGIKRKCEIVTEEGVEHTGYFRDLSSPVCLGCLLSNKRNNKERKTNKGNYE